MLEKFEDLKGRTLTSVENVDSEELIFTLTSGEKYKLYRKQDCCYAKFYGHNNDGEVIWVLERTDKPENAMPVFDSIGANPVCTCAASRVLHETSCLLAHAAGN